MFVLWGRLWEDGGDEVCRLPGKSSWGKSVSDEAVAVEEIEI